MYVSLKISAYFTDQDFLLLAMLSYYNLEEWVVLWSDVCVISKIVSSALVTALLLQEGLGTRLGLQGL